MSFDSRAIIVQPSSISVHEVQFKNNETYLAGIINQSVTRSSAPGMLQEICLNDESVTVLTINKDSSINSK
ncbi:hypothetical protein D3C87_891670 [compost metagenome]